MRAALGAALGILALAGAAAADELAVSRRQLGDELLGWCWGHDLMPEASPAERAAAPPACLAASTLWADRLVELFRRDGAGSEDGTRSIAVYVAACMAMNDVRLQARSEDGACRTIDRRAAASWLGEALAAEDREAVARQLAERIPDATPAAEARSKLEAIGFGCDAAPGDALVCLFSLRDLAYAGREPTRFASVFWSLELALDGDSRIAARRIDVATVHP